MLEFTQALKEGLDQRQIPYTPAMLESAAAYAFYLLEENQKMNLTAITDETDVAVKHFIDSLCLLQYGNIPKGSSLIDVGTGAGFPGMVLKIFRPDLKVTLADSLKKRCGFLERLCGEVGIHDVAVCWGRAEDLARQPELRETFDFAAARAVASLPVLLEYTVPFLKPGGSFFAMKAKAEAVSPEKALKELKAVITKETEYRLNGDERRLIEVKKTGKTGDKYPRRCGVPEKTPLA